MTHVIEDYFCWVYTFFKWNDFHTNNRSKGEKMKILHNAVVITALFLATELSGNLQIAQGESSPATCNTALKKDPYLKDLSYEGSGRQADPKRFDLVVKETRWNVVDAKPEKGATVAAWSYNGVVPGPVIRVTNGDWVKIKVTNQLPKKVPAYAEGAKTTDTAVHFHGVDVPYSMDGTPPLTQPFIKSGQSFTHEFQIRQESGIHIYHTHVDTEIQVGLGLYGTFIIEPKPAEAIPCDREYIQTISDANGYFLLNGKSFPSTALGENPSNLVKVKQGERILLRLLDITASDTFHTMHTHGHYFKVIAKDGAAWPEGPKMDTLLITPGERYDLMLIADADRADGKALWPFHCHVLPHLSNPDKETEHMDMGGMVTVIAYE